MLNISSSRWLPWQRYVLFRETQPPTGLVPWLRETSSLTERLREEVGNIDVELITLYTQNLDLETAHRLRLHSRTAAMYREVAIRHGESICFRARTYIPKSSIVRDTRRLKGWQNRSLGDFLFRNPRQQYSELEFSNVLIDGELHWARRRCHYLYNRPILVCEYFPETSLCQWIR